MREMPLGKQFEFTEKTQSAPGRNTTSKVPKKAVQTNKLQTLLNDPYQLIRFPLNTEKALKQLEEHNVLTFICDIRANKMSIKKALQQAYGCKVTKVRTLIRPQGDKKAYVTLHKDQDGMEIASKHGLV